VNVCNLESIPSESPGQPPASLLAGRACRCAAAPSRGGGGRSRIPFRVIPSHSESIRVNPSQFGGRQPGWSIRVGRNAARPLPSAPRASPGVTAATRHSESESGHSESESVAMGTVGAACGLQAAKAANGRVPPPPPPPRCRRCRRHAAAAAAGPKHWLNLDCASYSDPEPAGSPP
jgi:hypothetical protein